MKKIPNQAKIISVITSILIFAYMSFNPFILQTFFKRKIGEFDYFLGFRTNHFDFLLLSLIPIAALVFNSKRKEFTLKKIIIDNIIIIVSVLITLEIGYYLMSFIGKPDNPLIPEYLVSEPFDSYSLLAIMTGICIPILFRELKSLNDSRNKITEEINQIGKEN
ncbi:hypothetical protein [Snuella lapsa]|uniref:Uncharacterized protein n=1 Tax=Snuella lapsa TaxID=870481 RepID=A0ABP6XAA4_9FLAO